MGDVPRSVRPPSRAVARRRRAAALIVLVVALGAVALGIWSATKRGNDAHPVVAASPTPTETPKPTAARPEDLAPRAVATPTAPDVPRCSSPALTVTARVNAPRIPATAKPQFSLEVKNTGTAPCALDVGTAKQAFVVTVGTDTVWNSTVCQKDGKSTIVKLEPGQSLASQPFEWSKERSEPGTCTSTRAAAPGGSTTYNLVATVDGIASTPVAFVLE